MNTREIQYSDNSTNQVSKIIGYFPGNKIGFGGSEARAVMKDWCHNAIYGDYRLTNSAYDYEFSLKKLNTLILSFSIENDHLASKTAIENLHKKFNPDSTILHFHLTSAKTKISPLNHFSWAKDPSYFGQLIKDWLRRT